MKDKALLVIVGLLLLMSIFVDFTSKIMSIGADALFVGLAGFFMWMYFKDKKNEPSK